MSYLAQLQFGRDDNEDDEEMGMLLKEAQEATVPIKMVDEGYLLSSTSVAYLRV